jgi:hypothetical protein
MKANRGQSASRENFAGDGLNSKIGGDAAPPPPNLNAASQI